ncbi:hypothetical protein GCM10025794_34230 [Massilia kyonggiensis]
MPRQVPTEDQPRAHAIVAARKLLEDKKKLSSTTKKRFGSQGMFVQDEMKERRWMAVPNQIETDI